MRISDWSSDVCSSDLIACRHSMLIAASEQCSTCGGTNAGRVETIIAQARIGQTLEIGGGDWPAKNAGGGKTGIIGHDEEDIGRALWCRSEEHTSELQSLMRISYAVFCLKKKKKEQSLPVR